MQTGFGLQFRNHIEKLGLDVHRSLQTCVDVLHLSYKYRLSKESGDGRGKLSSPLVRGRGSLAETDLRFPRLPNDRFDLGPEQSRLVFKFASDGPHFRTGWRSGRVCNARLDKFWLNPLRDPMFEACRRLVWQDNAQGTVPEKQQRWRSLRESEDCRCVFSSAFTRKSGSGMNDPEGSHEKRSR
jgi:hypothetical protein